MKIHEYQGKEVLRKYGVSTLEGYVAFSPAEARDAAKRLTEGTGVPVVVVKSQVHAGGRGKGRIKEHSTAEVLAQVLRGEENVPGKGGVRVVKTAEAAEEAAKDLLGNTLVTKQTGPQGSKVRKVYVEAGCRIARELYLAILLDRTVARVLIMASAEGGTEIEEVAAHSPEKILKVWVDPVCGLGSWQARELAFQLGMTGKTVNSFVKLLAGLCRAYDATDASMLEINPLIVTEEGECLALDAKMTFDENGLFRHPEIVAMRDLEEEDAQEIEASRYDLSYVKLDGEIGCLVNGAGLAMATMDIIKLYGAEPANFLDVGGGANKEKVTAAFKIITADPAVKGILVNIFGGIMKCDVIAEGVLAAVRETGLQVPLVVRLEGTNVDLGKKILAESGLAVIPADTMADAAEKIVSAVNTYNLRLDESSVGSAR
ncbi:MAG: ADP-forming succinate--CoA ligase subunit beta [Myxococcales bacterium]|nr:ADP-forming succinate--CoA ligase subunit beta [Myxococcales bacterium]